MLTKTVYFPSSLCAFSYTNCLPIRRKKYVVMFCKRKNLCIFVVDMTHTLFVLGKCDNFLSFISLIFTFLRFVMQLRNIRRQIFVGVLLLTSSVIWAQAPNGTGTYYQHTDGLKGAALKTAFHKVIMAPKVKSYKELWTVYRTTDRRPDGKLYDIYSNITNYVIGSSAQGANCSSEGKAYNREHTMPKSWFNSALPMKSDAFHVMPSDGHVNNKRSNYPYGETKGEMYQSNNGYSKLGKCTLPGYSGIVFEPNDEYKGDLARVYFYMATCYESQIANWNSDVMSHNPYRPYVKWQMDMLMKWAKQDPVSEKEKARNEAVYKVQGNRNPFVDYPGLEDYLWGDSVSVAFSYDHYQGGHAPVVPSPDPQPGVDPQPSVTEETVLQESFAGGRGEFTVDDKSLPAHMRYVWSSYKNNYVSCMKASAYVGKQNQAAESWLISPVIDLTSYTQAVLTFEQACNFLKTYKNRAKEFLSVCVSDDGGTHWKNCSVDIPHRDNWTFVPTEVDLTEFAGKKVQIAFVYKSTTVCAPTWEIMNLKLTGKKTPTYIYRVTKDHIPLDVLKPMFDLSGRRVNRYHHGVVIQNGHKYIKR